MRAQPFTSGRMIALAAICLSLAACAGRPKPEAKVVPVEVAMPVAVSCVPPETPPAPDFSAQVAAAIKLPTAEERLQAVAALVPKLLARLRTVEPVLALCRQP